ncbi:MAG TPA: CHAT domain-containing tetratricopeptide repeat protein [Streptosporangiaceae bacterium]|nr:CHAT domain-containing tetratricopeptide repeat protein [Streptosporangiaceae bacterium]
MSTAATREPAAGALAWLDVPVEQLPLLAHSRPGDIAPVAERVLATTRDPYPRSYAAQALGLASRGQGDVRQAVRYLRAALAAAASCGKEREADVQASLGPTLAYAGRSAEALRHMDEAVSKTSGVMAERVRMRRGAVLLILGRSGEAIEDMRRAARSLRAAGDSVWEARTLINLAQALVDRGDPEAAEEALSRAEPLLQASDQEFEAAVARCNRGLAVALLGNVPAALAHYDAAEQMYAAAGAHPLELAESRSAALLAAGLHADALRHGREAAAILRGQGSSPAYLATALLRVADAALAAGEPELARASAAESARLFRRQGRDRGETLARIKVARARYASGECSRRLFLDASAAAAAADSHRVPEAVEAHLLAADVALALDDQAAAEPHLVRAARARSGRLTAGRVLGWYAAARRAHVTRRPKAVFHACEQGLRILEAYQLSLGAVEMRAAATAHGSTLAAIASREALAADDPRLLLRWTERWRATTFALPPVRPPDDGELAAALASLRLQTRLIGAATASGAPTSGLERERLRVEEEVRRHVLRTSGADAESGIPRADVDVDEILAALGDARLVEISGLDGRLHVLVATAGGVRRYDGGTWAAALREAEFSRFALQRLAYHAQPGGPPSEGRDPARAIAASAAALEASAERLQQELFAAALAELGDGPLVIAPPAALHAVPWGALPSLKDKLVSVVPSALTWLRGRAADAPASRRVAVVMGPGLAGAATEVAGLASRYPDAEVLAAGAATAENVLASLEGRWLAHIAAHGSFRADNPLFSSLMLDDGPLTVHDLQRLRRAPYRLVLSCCDSGVTGSAGADELLGLVAALGQLGTAGVIAPVVAVNDAATVPVTLRLHERLAGGATTAAALRDARRSLRDEPWSYAAARAFVAFGAA